jgi:hypothetical protein
MQVYGREVGFRFTVGASAEISDLCPEGDIKRLGELLNGSYGQVSRDTAAIIVALSEGHERARRFEDPTYKPRPLSVEEIMSLSPAEFMDLQRAALAAWVEDKKPTVEVEPEKKESGKDKESS